MANDKYQMICDLINNHRCQTLKRMVWKLIYPNKTFNAKFYMKTTVDNGLPSSDPNYKEYEALYFENIETHKFIELKEDKTPIEVFVDDKKLY